MKRKDHSKALATGQNMTYGHVLSGPYAETTYIVSTETAWLNLMDNILVLAYDFNEFETILLHHVWCRIFTLFI